MTTIPQPQSFAPTTSRAVLRSAILFGLFSLPLLAAVLTGLIGTTGLVPAVRSDFWFGLSFLLACGLLAFMAYRIESLNRATRRLGEARGASQVEVLDSTMAFVNRLEKLTAGSLSVRVLDLANATRRLAAAPSFLSARCAPQTPYRQISAVKNEAAYQDLVCLIRRSCQAERGSYFCVPEGDLLASVSFCVVRREDGFYIFLLHGTKKALQVVLVHDDAFGRLMRDKFDSLWDHLATTETPLFHDGQLDTTQVERLVEEPPVRLAAEPFVPEPELCAA